MPTNPQALSDEDAEQFASSFKPAWQTDEDEDEATSVGDAPVMPAADDALSNTIVMEHAEATAAAATAASAIAEAVTEKAQIPEIAKASKKQTVIGLAAPPPPTVVNGAMVGSKEVTPVHPVPRPPSSAEAVEPDQVLEVASAGDTTARLPGSVAASSPNVVAAATVNANAPPPMRMGMGTQVMANRPMMPVQAQGPGPVIRRPPPAMAQGAGAPVSADPFKTRARASSSSDFEAFKPKKSNKAIIIAVIGVVALIGLGVGLKTFIGDDSHDASPKNEPLVTGPAATTNDIPPPPPPAETSATTATATSTATAATTATPTAAIVSPPPQHPTPVAVAPSPAPAPVRNDPPRWHPSPPPAAPPPAAAPKGSPKSGNGGIVRDNPF